MVGFGSFRALALACALIVAFAGPLAAAESDETDPTTEETGGLDSYDKLLAAALDGEPAARGALLALFNDLRGDSVAIAELAVQLIGALDGDAVAVIDAATMIADVASHTLSTRPIVRVSVGDNLVLPPGAMGWDFGAPDSVGFEGFRKVTAADQDIVPGAQGALQSTGGDDLLSDGLLNLHKFFVTVPDDTYRLILLTDASGNLTLASPLGDAIMVNGLRIPMPDGGSDSWQGNGVLGCGQNAGGAQGGGSYGNSDSWGVVGVAHGNREFPLHSVHCPQVCVGGVRRIVANALQQCHLPVASFSKCGHRCFHFGQIRHSGGHNHRLSLAGNVSQEGQVGYLS